MAFKLKGYLISASNLFFLNTFPNGHQNKWILNSATNLFCLDTFLMAIKINGFLISASNSFFLETFLKGNQNSTLSLISKLDVKAEFTNF